MILGLPFDTNVPDVLTKLVLVLRRSQSNFLDNLLLTKSEAERFETLTEKWFSWYDNKQRLENPRVLSGVIGRVSNSDAPAQCAKGMQVPAKQKEPEQEDLTPAQRKDALLAAVAGALNLYDKSSAKKRLAELQAIPLKGKGKKPSKRSFLTAAKLEKKDVLWAALVRLFHINSCLSETGYALTPKDADTLFFEVMGLSTVSMCAEQNRRPTVPVEDRDALIQIILLASIRQGASPFSESIERDNAEEYPKIRAGVVSNFH